MGYKSSLKNSLLMMAVFPVLLLGIIVTIVVAGGFGNAMRTEVEKELSYVASSVDDMLDIVFPGDYVTYGDTVLTLVKGENILNDRSEFIDSINEDTGLEISIFYNNIRFLTTVHNAQGERILGSYCSSMITEAVIKKGTSKFFPSVEIGDDIYFAYYQPLFNSDGTCAGMIGVAKKADQVEKLVARTVYPAIIITLVMVVMAIIISVNYSKKIIKDLTKLKDFMKEVENGNYNADFDYAVMKRNDEITDMCKSAVHMQKVVSTLVEHDALTGLYNRRSANRLLREMQSSLSDEKEQFALALGDIDYFKSVNDTYGHDAGDEVLKYVAYVLTKHTKGAGFASRWGGEEFLLGFRDVSADEASRLVMDILKEIREHILEYNDESIRITMSFGVTQGRDGCSLDDLIKDADDRLYLAKENGRNRIVVGENGETYEEKDTFSEDEGCANEQSEAVHEPEIDADILDYIKQLKSNKDA